jgi:hypothetical protein
MRLDVLWKKVLLTSMVATAVVACGGGGGGTAATAPVVTPPATFSLVGPQDADPVEFACGNSDGDKTHARYPARNGDYPGITLAAMPDGAVMGRTRTGQYPFTYTNFWIDKTGRRTTYTVRALDDVRVDTDGQLWWVGADQVLWRGALQPNGQDERIGSATGFGAIPTDGPSGQLALGQLKGFAATPGAAFLLVTNDAGTQYFVRRMTRNADASWQASSIAVPVYVAQSGDQVTVLSNRGGQLALVVARRTQLTGTVEFGTSSTRYSYWQWQADNVWHEVANQVSSSYVSSVVSTGGSGTSLMLDSVTLGDDGSLIWGGGYNATLYKMGQDGSWSVIARPGDISATAVGQEGDLQKSTFLTVYSVASAPNGGVLFYDYETCQVRKLVDQTLTTVSGPSYTIRAHFGSANLLGFDSHNALITGHTGNGYARDIHTVPRPTMASYDLASNRLTALDAIGSLQASTGDGCVFVKQSRPCTNYNLWPGVAGRFAGIDVASGTPYLSDTTTIYRLDAGKTVAVAIATVPSMVCSPSAFSDGTPDFPYFVVTESCPDPAAPNGPNVFVATVARFDVDSGSFLPAFPGKRSPLVAGETGFLQKRNDGGFWVAGSGGYVGSGGVISRLTGSGDRVFVAGNKNYPAQAKDGQGSAAEFANIKRIRSLADNRLLVLDGDAVRLVDDTGTVRTLFTLASSGIAGDSIVDLIPKGRDVYLTLANQPMLMLAKDAIP